MLSARDVKVAFGGRTVFENVSLDLGRGEAKGLAAPNGFGKTTLLRAIAGEPRGWSCRRSGSVEADGVPVRRAARYRGRVLFVPGNAASLYTEMNARDHLSAVRALWRQSAEGHTPGSSGSPVSVDDAIEACGLDAFCDKPVARLSKGMRQQVSFAAAYISGAPYLLLDEPFNALDPTNVARLARVLGTMAESGRGVLIASHLFDEIAGSCASIAFLRPDGVDEVPFGGGPLSFSELFMARYQAEHDARAEEEARAERDARAERKARAGRGGRAEGEARAGREAGSERR